VANAGNLEVEANEILNTPEEENAVKNITRLTVSRLALLPLLGALALGLSWPLASTAQDKTPDPGTHKHAGKSVDADKDLATQVRDLQDKIAKLEAALKQGHKATPSGTPDTAGMSGTPMGMMGDKKMGQGMMGMGGMEGMNPDQMMKMMQMMGGMQGKGMSGMSGMGSKGMDDDDMDMMAMMGMGSMGQSNGKGMKGMGKMQKTAALPGFPGASHIYHIGATGFFLDHPDHVKLTTQQQTILNGLKEKALLEKASHQRKIDEAEQELWTLTASDQPDAGKIDAKVREIEKLRGDQRLAFIGAVGEAAKVLTDEQRQKLMGLSADKADKAPAHAGH
jgi:Spy/CpxP family protein refolding chaperone